MGERPTVVPNRDAWFINPSGCCFPCPPPQEGTRSRAEGGRRPAYPAGSEVAPRDVTRRPVKGRLETLDLYESRRGGSVGVSPGPVPVRDGPGIAFREWERPLGKALIMYGWGVVWEVVRLRTGASTIAS